MIFPASVQESQKQSGQGFGPQSVAPHGQFPVSWHVSHFICCLPFESTDHFNSVVHHANLNLIYHRLFVLVRLDVSHPSQRMLAIPEHGNLLPLTPATNAVRRLGFHDVFHGPSFSSIELVGIRVFKVVAFRRFDGSAVSPLSAGNLGFQALFPLLQVLALIHGRSFLNSNKRRMYLLYAYRNAKSSEIVLQYQNNSSILPAYEEHGAYA
jgi:hypothetical protein